MEEQVRLAAEEWIARKTRMRHPKGKTDRGGRWYPTDEEQQPCCRTIRHPSRKWPWSLMTHCRSAQHVANLLGFEVSTLRKAAREIESIA